MRGTYLIILKLVLPVLIGYCSTGEAADCSFGYTKCLSDDKCIPLSWKCDGDADCEDNSDEHECPAKTCADTEFACSVNGSCVPERWKCDGEADCDNGEDEDPSLCAKGENKCPTGQFSCGDEHCISMNWVCDGVEDCDNGHDELNCTKTCEGNMFTCDDGSCIASGWRCDGDEDCIDGSDEAQCLDKQCAEGEFKCLDSKRCIDVKWRCDGDFDCADHSDEFCTYPSTDEPEICSPGEFKCVLEGECIHSSWKCDGDQDCADGSDEGEGCDYQCTENEFQCKSNNACIHSILRCDHSADCVDGSDEENCPRQNCSANGQFDCYNDGTMCLSMDQVCDSIEQCLHGEDENPDMCKARDPCLNHQCGHHAHCVKRTVSHNRMVAECECDAGFEMQGSFCKDIDECAEHGKCSQNCTNTIGGYKCSCYDGYVLEKHHYCRAEGDSAWLYYSNRRDIRRLRADTSFMEIVVEHTGNSVGIDMDINEDLLFWTDRSEVAIKSAKISANGPATDQKIIYKKTQTVDDFSSDGIAVDWLNKKIYWTENTEDKIMVANYDGTKSKTLVSGDLDDPRAIVVDPENGYIYWTDWGKNPKIERCEMDGSNRKVLLDNSMLGWPNGLAIDYVDKRLYWIDAKLHKIGSMNFNGSEVKYVFEDAREIQRPFALAVFEDSLYWTDWTTNAIRSVDKWTGLNPRTLNMGAYSVMDIKVYHSMRQNMAEKGQIESGCAAKNCEFMCLPKARSITSAPIPVTCVCGDGMVLNTDKRTCSQSKIPPTTPISESTTQKQTPKPKVTTQAPEVTTGKATQRPGYTVVPGSGSTEGAAGKKEDQNVGSIAVIAGAVAGVLILLAVVAGFLIMKKYKQRNKKSMNFDNPVYRKTTTDDHCSIDSEPQRESLVTYHDEDGPHV